MLSYESCHAWQSLETNLHDICMRCEPAPPATLRCQKLAQRVPPEKFLPLKLPLTSKGTCIPVTLTFAPWVRDTRCFLTSARTLLPSVLWISTVSCMVSNLLVSVASICPFLSHSTFFCKQTSC